MSTAATPSGVDHPSLVPASLLAGAGPAAVEQLAGDRDVDPDQAPDGRPVTPHPRRSVRDWLVDVACFVLAVALGMVGLGEELSRPDPLPDGLAFADAVVGGLACLGLWLRRRWPVGLAVALAIVGAFSVTAGGAVLISLFTVAVHRRWPVVAGVSALNVAGMLVFYTLRPDPDLPFVALVPIGLVMVAAVVAWGMFVRARRQLVLSLRERARRAEAEQQLRVDQARQTERTRIAREMHDVLAHRISLLSMHAGALEFRPDAAPEEISRAAGVIRDSAHLALQDLREVIGVLREGPDGVGARPQPTLADLPDLIEESRGAGVRVRVDYRVDDLSAVPIALGRSAYRIVQEGLTNVRKHAAGTAVNVVVDGRPGPGLTVEIRNRMALGQERAGGHVGSGAADAIPGCGTGLVGLAERAALAGGRLEHGRTQDGDFRLHAWLPWHDDDAGATPRPA